MPHLDWNVVITTASGAEAFRLVRDCLSEFGKAQRTDYWNVLVMRVDDVYQLLDDMGVLATCNPSFASAVSRVMPVTDAFSFQSPEEFESRACEMAGRWVARLRGTSFHVRMHRRGFKGRLSSQDEERFLDRFLLDALQALHSPARIDFEDPDYILGVESVGQRAGMSLWSREQLRRYPLLKLD